jgi:hypothetical protein
LILVAFTLHLQLSVTSPNGISTPEVIIVF